ncbi:MAG: sigma-54 dependent transcriptional regulator [Acidobacteriota bacterium]|nr:sigma-54 dependent transcriptional regulator [Acidobacteriota bacterium]
MTSITRTGRVLVVDDEMAVRQMAAAMLRSAGHHVAEAGSVHEAAARLRTASWDLLLTDYLLGDGATGLDLLDLVQAEALPCEVIIMTGQGGVADAVEAIRRGAYNFITKPLERQRLLIDVSRALEKRGLEEDLRRLSEGPAEGFGRLMGQSPEMQGLFAALRRAAGCESNVLLLGESGTGKEVAAREIHLHSRRREAPFVPVHCGALAPELLESELFGHQRGAFTGATGRRKGLFLSAQGGTLFLDEIATAPARVQIGLLRAIQERCIRPVGGDADISVDVRIIAATNADLDREMDGGGFRQDLYYRLATLVIRMPPLRERQTDIPLLARFFLERFSRREGRDLVLSPAALERLMTHRWPGNVRELEHLLESAMVRAEGEVIGEDDLDLPSTVEGGDRLPTLAEVERAHIARVLEVCGGNKKRAARILGLPRATLYRRIERYGLAPLPATRPTRPAGPVASPRPRSKDIHPS